ncbi:uncharacterized protein LOC113315810 [Papaver somniferum]|uniref:uncharacterized protein LOC113315810 n=1 Tax=Papaver somniferum TaxID=3469 RepID=UPI000E70533F|nr:uncharacterized protein LOC113315810 [Papaver somniferum]
MNFGERYLREPTPKDVQRLLAENAERGFPGMLGSVDCMQWPWKNCPVAWQGTYRGKEKHSSLVLEAVASYDLWFWHAFFGMPGSKNDLNVLAHSPLFYNMLKGVAPPCNYVINGYQYNMGYFLADGIYPKLTTIVQAFIQTLDIPNYVRLNKYQMYKRKDVERAFGVLQGKLRIFGSPYDFEHAFEYVYRDGHVGDEYKHDGDDDEDYDDEEDDDEDDDDDENDDDDAAYDDSEYNPSPFEDSSSESSDEE